MRETSDENMSSRNAPPPKKKKKTALWCSAGVGSPFRPKPWDSQAMTYTGLSAIPTGQATSLGEKKKVASLETLECAVSRWDIRETDTRT